MLRKTRTLVLGVLVAVLVMALSPAAAQDVTPDAMHTTPIRVEIQSADGVTLVGDLYNAELNVQTPAVLLMHMLGGRRGDWQPLLPALTNAGYRVLTVDLRGHGESGGRQNWEKAVDDVQAWLDWIYNQPAIDPEHVAVVGASIGSNLALIGCANESRCVTAVALSPGMNYRGIGPSAAISDGYADRSFLLIASQDDRPSGGDVKAMLTLAQGEVGMQLYPGGVHGTNLLVTQGDSVIPLIVNWLDIHLR